MNRLRQHRSDLAALLILFILPLLWFFPVLFPGLGGYTLLPYDNLYSFEPWHSLQPNLIPHNNLLSDLVLENAVWKLHIQRTLAEGQLPLWNPQIFTGVPFLAAGQASTFYPLSILFYILPLESAYGWFTALQIALAGINLYLLGRALQLRPPAALFGGVVYMFSGFLIASVVFTMFIAAAAWLPLLLALIEFVIRKQEEKGTRSFRPIPYMILGAAVIGIMILAGHPELIYYTMLVAGAYSAVRLLVAWRRIHAETQQQASTQSMNAAVQSSINPWKTLLNLATWLLVMAVLGISMGAVQLIPLLELLPQNFREGSATYQQVVEWAWPDRHILAFFLPNIFGNPSHHHWLDLWRGIWVPATQNAFGEPNDTIFWGIKNYVEGGNYVGLITWLFAAIAILRVVITHSHKGHEHTAQAAAQPPVQTPVQIHRVPTWFFSALALISLLFAFGTPLYAILFYGLPGWAQLHSPFRWVFPFTLSMAILGGIGLQTLTDIHIDQSQERIGARWFRQINLPAITTLIACLSMLAGIGTLTVVVISRFIPEPFIALGQRLVDGSDLAQMAFADGRMFWGYQVPNLAHFGAVALLAGILIWLGNRRRQPSQFLRTIGPLLIVALVFIDLYAAHGRFNPAADPALNPLIPENQPPAIQFINERESGEMQTPLMQTSPWRFTTFNLPGAKTFNANVGMYYGWHDIRGYDSIIPRQYVDLMDRIAPQANELLYNRIAPLYSDVGDDFYAILDSPLLDLLNVKYILTEEFIPLQSWQEVYRDQAVGIYENSQMMARAFIVPEAQLLPIDEQPLLEADLSQVVFIEERPDPPSAAQPASPQIKEAAISRYTANDLFVDINLSDRGWLVVTDAYFPGWKAFIRPFGGNESQETELPIYRANGAFRTVYLPEAGQWTVRFVYSPMSFKLGLYISFLSAMTAILLLLWWGWGRYYRPEETIGEVRTVAKNSLVPMILSLSNKAIDFAFAMLYVRLLGPEGTGKYYFVVAIYGFFEIVSRYGLGTLLTRDVAADKHQSSRYLTNVIALRTLLWLATLPVLALVTYGFRSIADIGLGRQNIGVEEVQAIAILAVAMLFANWADALSNTFNAFEKMEYPAGLTCAIAILKVSLGALALLLGWGFVGLAGVSLLMNILQLGWLYSLLRNTLFKPQWQWDWSLQRQMLGSSGPLMINHLLATIFWRIDIWILRPLAATSVGLYSVGIKYLDGLNIIPSVFTMAIFPVMSRYAKGDGDHLLRSYILSLRLLVMISLPIAMLVTFVAEPLVYLVGGAEFLNLPETISVFGREFAYTGGAALAFRVIIWSIPIGFVNSVTQFVLIAVNQQHYLTKAFIFGVIFNTVGNLLTIPTFGYLGAAVITILSEFSLLFPFYYSVKRNVGTVPWRSILTAPALSVAIMGIVIYALLSLSLNLWMAVLIGCGAYGIALILTGAFRGEDMARVLALLPVGRLQRLLPMGRETRVDG